MSESIFRSLRSLSYREKQYYDKSKPSYKQTYAGKSLLVSIVLILLSVIFAAIYKFYKCDVIKFISMGLIVLSYILYYLQPFILMYENRGKIYKTISNPLVTQLEAAEVTMKIRNIYKKYLISRSTEDLKFTQNLLTNQKSDFENSVSLIVGSLDKFGLTPGLLALILSLGKIQDMKYDWLLIIVYIIPVLYIFAVYCRLTISKLQSHISLIELVIDEKSLKVKKLILDSH